MSAAPPLSRLLAVATGIAVNDLGADRWRAVLVTGYGIAAVFGLVVMFGCELIHRPDANALTELHGANPSVRLRHLLGDKIDSATLNAARLVRLEWSWRAHVVAVAGSAVLTSAYAVVRSL